MPRTPAAKTGRVSAAEKRRRAAQAAAETPATPAEPEVKGGVLIAIVPTADSAVDELRISPIGDTRPLEVGDLLAKALAIHRRRNEA